MCVVTRRGRAGVAVAAALPRYQGSRRFERLDEERIIRRLGQSALRDEQGPEQVATSPVGVLLHRLVDELEREAAINASMIASSPRFRPAGSPRTS